MNSQIYENYSLKTRNTFALEVSTRYFASVASVASLAEVLAQHPSTAKLFLGAGSNLLLTQDFPGIVLHIAFLGIQKIEETDDTVLLAVGAGESWDSLVQHAVENNYAGIENLVSIPGSVGAAPVQNIGAYGVEFQEVFASLDAYDIQEGKSKIFTREDCHFGYRESIFKHAPHLLITTVRIRLNKASQKTLFRTSYPGIPEEIEKRKPNVLTPRLLAEIIQGIRKNKLPDPKELGNAGSFFKNPEIPLADYERLREKYPSLVGYPASQNRMKVGAGWLIDACGWKGKRIGNTGAYARQALILLNYGNATGKEILALAREIQHSVYEKFGIRLEPEVVIV